MPAASSTRDELTSHGLAGTWVRSVSRLLGQSHAREEKAGVRARSTGSRLASSRLARRLRTSAGAGIPAIAGLGGVPRQLDPLIEAVLVAVTRRELSPAEQQVAERIEVRREELRASDRMVEYRDYGAGAPTTARPTDDEAAAGRLGTQSLGRLTTVASKDRMWAALLMRLVRHTRPHSCVEMGAAVGISAAYQAAALRLNGHGHLVTLEGGQALAEVAEATLASLDLSGIARVVPGRFADTLPAVLGEAAPDYVFIDGHHDGQATTDYFAQVEAVMPRGVVVLDDIDWSEGMRQAWQEISTAPSVAASVDLGPLGVCVLGESRAPLHCRLEY